MLPTLAASAPPTVLTAMRRDGVSRNPAAPVTATRPAIALFATGGGRVCRLFCTGGDASKYCPKTS